MFDCVEIEQWIGTEDGLLVTKLWNKFKVSVWFHDASRDFIFLSFWLHRDRLLMTMSVLVLVEHSSDKYNGFNLVEMLEN